MIITHRATRIATTSLFLAGFLASVIGCTRDTGRPAKSESSDQATESRTADQPQADMRGQAPTGSSQAEPQVNKAIPRDEKGIPGSPYAGNIKSSTTGQSPRLQGTVDVTQYNYSQRNEFKNLMQERLESIDEGIEGMKAAKTSEAQQAPKPQWSEKRTDQTARQQKITELERQHDRVTQELQRIDRVQASEWDTFKNKFRDDVAALESNYQGLAASVTR